MKQGKVPVTCPKCGHTQPEPATAYSSVCKQCHQHFRVQEVLRPAAPPRQSPRETRRIACFKCAAELEVPLSAQSTMCKRCSSHVDLRDYQITNAVSKNFRTKGRFLIETAGFLFNTDTIAGEVILKGRLLGKLTAERSLEIHAGAEIKGDFKTARLIVPVGSRFHWRQTIPVVSAEIGGELVANLRAEQTVTLKATARFFGRIEATGLAIEEGAVVVGSAKIAA